MVVGSGLPAVSVAAVEQGAAPLHCLLAEITPSFPALARMLLVAPVELFSHLWQSVCEFY